MRNIRSQSPDGQKKRSNEQNNPQRGERKSANEGAGRKSGGKSILIVGGAGFIGSHLVDKLITRGYRVRVLDNLSPQVHGPANGLPDYLNPEAEVILGDVRDGDLIQKSLQGIDAVYHLAAAVGVGQSMYEIERYTSVNMLGTAALLQNLIRHPVEKLIVASSMSIYGEGLYVAMDGTVHPGATRSVDQLRQGAWEPRDEKGGILKPIPTPETKQPYLASIYAITKFTQEQMCLIFGRAYNIPTVAFRFFNVYGTRQALSNPYTGVLAIFASRYLNDKPPLIFEDGLQRRDFVSVHDVTEACCLALETRTAEESVFNIGSGHAYTIREVAGAMAKAVGKEAIEPIITGKHRMGDIRHCFADIERAQSILGYQPKVTLEKGLNELAQWLEGQIAFDGVDLAKLELDKRGLTI